MHELQKIERGAIKSHFHDGHTDRRADIINYRVTSLLKNKHKDRKMHKVRHTNKNTNRHKKDIYNTDKQTDKFTNKQTSRQTKTQTYKQTDRQTNNNDNNNLFLGEIVMMYVESGQASLLAVWLADKSCLVRIHADKVSIYVHM